MVRCNSQVNKLEEAVRNNNIASLDFGTTVEELEYFLDPFRDTSELEFFEVGDNFMEEMGCPADTVPDYCCTEETTTEFSEPLVSTVHEAMCLTDEVPDFCYSEEVVDTLSANPLTVIVDTTNTVPSSSCGESVSRISECESYFTDCDIASYTTESTSGSCAGDTHLSELNDVFQEVISKGEITPIVKHGLRNRIQSRRIEEGKGELVVEFKDPEPETLTPDEQNRRDDRRERNRVAAQKCRNRKRERCDVLETETRKLQRHQDKLNNQVRSLREERDHLLDIIKIHQSVCPLMQNPKQTGD